MRFGLIRGGKYHTVGIEIGPIPQDTVISRVGWSSVEWISTHVSCYAAVMGQIHRRLPPQHCRLVKSNSLRKQTSSTPMLPQRPTIKSLQVVKQGRTSDSPPPLISFMSKAILSNIRCLVMAAFHIVWDMHMLILQVHQDFRSLQRQHSWHRP
jgi:hypothetical protein